MKFKILLVKNDDESLLSIKEYLNNNKIFFPMMILSEFLI